MQFSFLTCVGHQTSSEVSFSDYRSRLPGVGRESIMGTSYIFVYICLCFSTCGESAFGKVYLLYLDKLGQMSGSASSRCTRIGSQQRPYLESTVRLLPLFYSSGIGLQADKSSRAPTGVPARIHSLEAKPRTASARGI